MLVVAVDDEPNILEFYVAALSGADVRVETANNAADGLKLVRELNPDLVVLDLVMPGEKGLELLKKIRQFDRKTHVVMATGQYTIETAVEAIREGATDYICKPVSVEKLRSIVAQVRQEESQNKRAQALDKELVDVFKVGGLIGRSPAMLEVFDLVQRIAPHYRTALVLGETGTGKELVARALHNLSQRRNHRLAICNCAAVVESLSESELFGHKRGAFTGASENKTGLFEWADKGTVLLDEVGELSAAMQSKLLRVLENSEIQKVGSPQTQQVDVAVIGATSRSLDQDVKAGKFRSDLLYRLNMVEIRLPPLRDRKEDIHLLARHMLDQFNKQYDKEIQGFSRQAMNAMLAYQWPGNVRELQNVIGRACLLARGTFIEVEDLPNVGRDPAPAAESPAGTLEDVEKAALLRALSSTKRKSQVARKLGISRATLYRLLRKYEI